MKILETSLLGVLIIEPTIFVDDRGCFVEIFNAERYAKAGLREPFVQDNFSHSKSGVLRGLHLQWPNPQGKLVSVIAGRVLDVAADVRVGSPTFGKSVAVELDSLKRRQLWIPGGFAHGFVVLSEEADFLYKCDAGYSPKDEIAIRWNDSRLDIDWPISHPHLTGKDAEAPFLLDILDRLPAFEV